jgi:hypothetical protein
VVVRVEEAAAAAAGGAGGAAASLSRSACVKPSSRCATDVE